MSDMRELYQEVILDHGRNPRNFGPLPGANREAYGYNPLCGDKITLHLKVNDGVVTDVGFEGAGCAISMASASLMTEILRGKTETEARNLFGQFHELLTSDNSDILDNLESLDKLAVFSGVRDYPLRVKCATLGWHTLTAALDQNDEMVVTE